MILNCWTPCVGMDPRSVNRRSCAANPERAEDTHYRLRRHRATSVQQHTRPETHQSLGGAPENKVTKGLQGTNCQVQGASDLLRTAATVDEGRQVQTSTAALALGALDELSSSPRDDSLELLTKTEAKPNTAATLGQHEKSCPRGACPAVRQDQHVSIDINAAQWQERRFHCGHFRD